MAAQRRVQLPKPKSAGARRRRNGGDPSGDESRRDETVVDARRVLADAERFLSRTDEAA